MEEIDVEQGESEAICLAKQLQALRIILDEDRVREYARKAGFKVIGTLGILILAKKENLITDLKEKIDELKVKGFRVGDKLYNDILQQAE